MTESVHYAAPRVYGCFAARDEPAAYGVELSSPCGLRRNGHGANEKHGRHGALISWSSGQPHQVLRQAAITNYRERERDQLTRSRLDGATEQGWGWEGRQATKTSNIPVHERTCSCVAEKATKTQRTHTHKKQSSVSDSPCSERPTPKAVSFSPLWSIYFCHHRMKTAFKRQTKRGRRQAEALLTSLSPFCAIRCLDGPCRHDQIQ